jgi:hypothetical protein
MANAIEYASRRSMVLQLRGATSTICCGFRCAKNARQRTNKLTGPEVFSGHSTESKLVMPSGTYQAVSGGHQLKVTTYNNQTAKAMEILSKNRLIFPCLISQENKSLPSLKVPQDVHLSHPLHLLL